MAVVGYLAKSYAVIMRIRETFRLKWRHRNDLSGSAMPVNLSPPNPDQLLPVKGVTLGIAEAGIKKANRKDLLVMRLGEQARVAGVFTLNRFCAAPVTLCKAST